MEGELRQKRSSEFWDGIAARYSRRPVRNPTAYQQTLERTRTFLHRHDRVLELGCGTGTTALLLSPSVHHLTATDISGNMLEIGRSKAAAQHAPNIRFARASHLDGSFEKPFDVVIAFNLLHLLEDLPQALDHIRTLLRPGGRFITKTPCLGSRPVLKLVIAALRLARKAPYVSFLSPSELEQSLTAAGFVILETGDYPPSPPAHFIAAQLEGWPGANEVRSRPHRPN